MIKTVTVEDHATRELVNRETNLHGYSGSRCRTLAIHTIIETGLIPSTAIRANTAGGAYRNSIGTVREAKWPLEEVMLKHETFDDKLICDGSR